MNKVVLLFLMICSYAVCKAQGSDNSAKAIVNYNSEKRGDKDINFNSSFMIQNHNIDAAEKEKIYAAVKTKDSSIKKIQLIDVDNKTGMLVLVDFFAADKTELAKKIRIILSEIGINNVESNGKFFTSLNEFSFN